jgi:hypothetical protein
MNREDIIRIAHESHLDVYGLGKDYAKFADALERFADLVRKDYSTTHANLWLDRIHKFVLEEREACAELCEMLDIANPKGKSWDEGTIDCANAIRARRQA